MHDAPQLNLGRDLILSVINQLFTLYRVFVKRDKTKGQKFRGSMIYKTSVCPGSHVYILGHGVIIYMDNRSPFI